MVQDLLINLKPKMEAALAHFVEELKTVRTGRANIAMLDTVTVTVYGAQVPLRQVATITVPEATQILVQPFDPSTIPAIRTGIEEAQLGFNPSDDGRALRLNVPPLTSERREEYVKKVGKMAEETRISVRTIRGEAWDHIQKAQKEGEISEDNRDWGRAELDKVTAEFNRRIEETAKAKEAELRTV